MQMHRYELTKAYHRGGGTTFHVTLYTQPWWRAMLAEVYHWYDMHVEKLPGLHKFEHWLDKRNDDVDSIPHCARRDIRCFQLQQAGRVVLLTTEITDQEYSTLTEKRQGR